MAQAVAYDHVPETKRAERHAKALTATKPMTKLYHKVPPENTYKQDPADHRPGNERTHLVLITIEGLSCQDHPNS